MLDNAVRIIQEDHDLRAYSCLSCDPSFDETSSIAAAIRSFLSTPIFNEWRDLNLLDVVPFGDVIQSVERLLNAFVNLYEGYSQHVMNLQSETITLDIAAADSIQSSCLHDRSKNRIVDVELDVNDDSRDMDSLAVGKKIGGDVSSSAEKWKMGMILLISYFFSATHVLTWDVLFKLMDKESDPKVDIRHCNKYTTDVLEFIISMEISSLYLYDLYPFKIQVRGKILYHLCQHPHWSSSAKFIDLV